MTGEINKIKQQRPLSPHLSIYKPQITSVLSITHRITGVGLFAGVIFFAVWIIFNVYGCGDCINPLVASTLGKILIFLWSAALYYHLLNGVRHLFWDAGKGFEIATLEKSGIAVMLGVIVLLLLTWSSVLGIG